MTTFKIDLNGQDITSQTILPIKWNNLLDERLDEGRVSLRNTDTELYPPFAPITISMTADGETSEKHFIVWADNSQELPVGSGKFNHELSLIEPTKLLERYVMDTLTFQNPLGRAFNGNAVKVEPVYE